MCRRVALLARQGRVFPFQVVPRKPVVKFLLRRLPVDKVVILPIVFQVAPNAILPVRVVHLNLRMVSVLPGKGLCNFLVALDTFEGWRAGPERMASGALCRSAQ